MIEVEIHFFGGIKRFTRQIPANLSGDRVSITLPDGATVDDLLAALAIGAETGRPFVSINRFYVRDNVALGPGDRVELLLPVAGGT